ncbi:hypothetical protein JIN77_07930 [Verrucomicrobiaceae bacterium R5-34]|nr:hypothetical protein [Verrucomicrobiaceae bacterium R5-34]
MNASFGEKFRAVLATGRVANLPTVWSNVLMAYLMAETLQNSGHSYYFNGVETFQLWMLGLIMLAGSLLYVGGCMLGDYRDIPFDTEHRPGRPIPSGVLSPSFVAISAITLLGLGLVVGAASFPVAIIYGFKVPWDALKSASGNDLQSLVQTDQLALLGVLVALIVVYALFHKRSRPLALVNMALCRTQLVIFAAAAALPAFFSTSSTTPTFHGQWIIAPVLITGAAVGIYTLLLASVAATESNQEKIKYSLFLKAAMFLLPLLAIALMLSLGFEPKQDSYPWGNSSLTAETSRPLFYTVLIIYCSWMLFAFRALPNDKPAFVSRALAGFSLLDASFAASYSVTVPLICLALFGLALLLQKIAPAT